MTFHRRRFLQQCSAALAAAALVQVPVWARPRFAADPFSLGVASGDPSPDGFVLWTRLAPRPFELDGGMPHAAVEVRWEVAADESFRRIVQSGVASAHPELAHSVHVEPKGLQPHTRYWYRFMVADAVSPVGRVRTAPAESALPGLMKMAVVGCHHYEAGYFTAFGHMAAESDLDLVFHYGDYIYETGSGSSRGFGGMRVQMPERPHIGGETYTLDEYRLRYAVYKADPHLKEAHQAAAFAITFDDHEVDNDWASTHDTRGATVADLMARRAAAFQAWYEHMPVRLAQKPDGPMVTAYRTLPYGQLLRLQLLDTRSFRDDQLCSATQIRQRVKHCRPERVAEETMLGAAQEAWLNKQLQHDARWNVLAQQVMMMPRDARKTESSAPVRSADKWDGYPHARQRLADALRTYRPKDNIVLSGDYHQYYVGVVPSDVERPDSAPLAPEFLTTSLSSGGDGSPERPGQERMLSNNPHFQLVNDQRGYQMFEFTPGEVRTELRVIDRVEVPDGKVTPLARFVVKAGDPRAHRE